MVYLVQHGQAKRDDEDPQRPLTARGADRRCGRRARQGSSATTKRRDPSPNRLTNMRRYSLPLRRLEALTGLRLPSTTPKLPPLPPLRLSRCVTTNTWCFRVLPLGSTRSHGGGGHRRRRPMGAQWVRRFSTRPHDELRTCSFEGPQPMLPDRPRPGWHVGRTGQNGDRTSCRPPPYDAREATGGKAPYTSSESRSPPIGDTVAVVWCALLFRTARQRSGLRSAEAGLRSDASSAGRRPLTIGRPRVAPVLRRSKMRVDAGAACGDPADAKVSGTAVLATDAGDLTAFRRLVEVRAWLRAAGGLGSVHDRHRRAHGHLGRRWAARRPVRQHRATWPLRENVQRVLGVGAARPGKVPSMKLGSRSWMDPTPSSRSVRTSSWCRSWSMRVTPASPPSASP